MKHFEPCFLNRIDDPFLALSFYLFPGTLFNKVLFLLHNYFLILLFANKNNIKRHNL